MPTIPSPRGWLLALLVGAATPACNATPPGAENEGLDAGTIELRAPRLDPIAATPLATAPVRGVADGASRVVVQSADLPSEVAAPDEQGAFCLDAALGEGTTTFEVFAVSDDGRVSSATEIEVQREPGLAEPVHARCSDVAPYADEETCDNGSDDDGNGHIDSCDPGCNGCLDDLFEPNDGPHNVPTVQVGSYPDLWICPCRNDWYAFHVTSAYDPVTNQYRLKDQHIKVTVGFNAANIDIDLRLFRAADAEAGGVTDVAHSVGSTGTETIDYTATTAGTFYLKVVGYPSPGDPQPRGKYTMAID